MQSLMSFNGATHDVTNLSYQNVKSSQIAVGYKSSFYSTFKIASAIANKKSTII